MKLRKNLRPKKHQEQNYGDHDQAGQPSQGSQDGCGAQAGQEDQGDQEYNADMHMRLGSEPHG
jgi:hypothetical protein